MKLIIPSRLFLFPVPGIILLLSLCFHARAAQAEKKETHAKTGPDSSLLIWSPPSSFDPKLKQLGLPPLPRIQSTVIYRPKTMNPTARTYPGTMFGTFNHHPRATFYKNYILVAWRNHARDEDGPGDRILGKMGKFNSDFSDIRWESSDRCHELVPPAIEVALRPDLGDPKRVRIVNVFGSLDVRGGKLFTTTSVTALDGFSNDRRFILQGLRKDELIPDKNYSLTFDRKKGFHIGIFITLGTFVQQWDIQNDQLKPVGPIWRIHDLIENRVSLTPTISKALPPLNPVYQNAPSFDRAPKDVQKAYHQKTPSASPSVVQFISGYGGAKLFAPETAQKATDGKNGLTHFTLFRRPDGQLVIVRDNLWNKNNYYVSIRKDGEKFFPIGERTNLFGSSMPLAGTLPSGKAWFIGSNKERTESYITLSEDGIHFDRTFSLFSIYFQIHPGICKGSMDPSLSKVVAGAQYFSGFRNSKYLWLIYSIGKELVGVSKISIADLENLPPSSDRYSAKSQSDKK